MDHGEASPHPYVDDLEDLPDWAEKTVNQLYPQSHVRDERIARLVKEAAPDVPDDLRNASGAVMGTKAAKLAFFHSDYFIYSNSRQRSKISFNAVGLYGTR